MKIKSRILLAFLCMMPFFILAQTGNVAKKEYTYESYPNDPLKARIYTLENGLKVYLSVYKNAPRIQTYIAVRAGSKTDPSDATGLAHYLEHMLFKGTDKFGSLDYEKEKVELAKIEELYESYRQTTDTAKRAMIYHKIDSVSGVAAKYSIANEYDKLLAAIGAKGTNAYTSVEQTVYVNDIPSNELEKWLKIEAERFRNPQLRLFHTEIEAVYEEKNRNLDSDDSKSWEALSAGLFPKHPYGTQTTIGTIEHLKNPSLKKIKKYYEDNYIPNNMALCMSGDFDMDKAIALIDANFGKLQRKELPKFTPPTETPISSPIEIDIYGPDAENLLLAYRLPGAGTKEADLMFAFDMILCNGKAGLIDLNLNQKQKVLESGTFPYGMKDYSAMIFFAKPKAGQSLEEAKDLLLIQIEKVKQGEFQDWLMKATINDLKLRETQQYESNSGRANSFVEAFILGTEWKTYIESLDRLSKITKQEVMDFAKKYFTNNYVVVYKHTGEDVHAMKVSKPAITPVEVNREAKSPFLSDILNTKSAEIRPVFLDFKTEISETKLKNDVPLFYKKNDENNLFNLYYKVDMGTNNDKKIGIATQYLSFLGTDKLSPEAFQEELYKLGVSFSVFADAEQIYVSLSGLSENFEPALKLFEGLLKAPKANQEALTELVSDILQKRSDSKLEKGTILWSAMYSYAQYGDLSPFKNILSADELKALKAEDLISEIKKITSYDHRVLYYGPMSVEKLTASLNANHASTAKKLSIPNPIVFTERNTSDSIVYVVNYDMKQAEILMLSKSGMYDKSLAPSAKLYNEYFGGSMSSIVFQELRESKALAYSVWAGYNTPAKVDRSFYNFAYIGAQADKLGEALKGMKDLLNVMPQSETMLKASKEALLKKIETERITRSAILFNYESAKKLNLNYDIRKDIYEKIPAMGMNEVTNFQNKYVKGQSFTLMVLGDEKILDMETLSKYGTVKKLELTDIFGY